MFRYWLKLLKRTLIKGFIKKEFNGKALAYDMMVDYILIGHF